MADYDLDYLLAQVRRIEEHREAGAETKIRTTYQKILKELRHYLADTYSQYAEDDKLTYDILQRHGRYARFLDEVEKKINDLSPETKRLIRSVVEQTYEHTYNGMIEAVKNTANDVVSGLKGCTPTILRRAVENPVSKLTLNDRLEKHRKEIIYDIKQAITVGLVNGDRYSTMANRIKQSLDGSYKKAIRISRTETHRVREAGNLDAAESVQTALNTGNVPLQMMKVWKTMKDERVRPAKQKGKNKQYDHRKMDGVAVKIDEMFTLPSGAKTMAPGQSGVAGEDINCRCYLSYELKHDERTAGPAKTEIQKLDEEFESGNIENLRIGDNHVDLEKIASNSYRRKFTQITANTSVNDSLRKYANAMLTHRNGTDGEDLYIISSKTGTRLFSKTIGANELGVSLSADEIAEIKAYAKSEGVIAIHNHPTNLFPTGSDFVSAGARGYDFGVVATHDGRVFTYKAGNKPFRSEYFDKTVDKYVSKPYNYNIEKAHMKALSEFVKEYGIEWEELT